MEPALCSSLQVLNLLLFRMTGAPYDEAQLAFLAVDEHLVDIGDDLCEFEQPGMLLDKHETHAMAVHADRLTPSAHAPGILVRLPQ